MRRGLLGILVALVLVTIALHRVPARAIPALLEETNLELSGLRGTALEGQAARALLRTNVGNLHLGTLDWTASIWSALRLQPSMTLNSRWGQQRLSAYATVRGRDDLELTDLDASVPAALLRQFLPVALDGLLKLQLQDFRWQRGAPRTANGRLVWEDATWLASTGARRLGTYVAEVVTTDDEVITAEVLTLSGSLNVTGSAQLSASR